MYNREHLVYFTIRRLCLELKKKRENGKIENVAGLDLWTVIECLSRRSRNLSAPTKAEFNTQ
jgi:hypothetical protein